MSFSDKFLEIMKSNIRPKCEPKITVTGTDSNGVKRTVIWNAKDIKSLSFHRSIDPVGRELPTMELKWTEVYYGKFDSQNFPLKYDNIIKNMAVNLEFEQSLGFYRTWKNLKEKFTWKSLKSLTWNKLKSETDKETISMPMMFLVGTPEISEHTITWTAKDALSLLTGNQKYSITSQVPFYNPIIYLLINARGSYMDYPELFEYFTRCIDYFVELGKTTTRLNKDIIFDGATNELLLNYLSVINQYMDFDNDKIIVKDFSTNANKTADISLKLQYKGVKLSPVLSCGGYSYKQYHTVMQPQNAYTKSPDVSESYGTGYRLTYYFDGYGDTTHNHDIVHAVRASQSTGETISVTPISYEAISGYIQGQNKGEIFNEDNPLNSGGWESDRMNALNDWFFDGMHVVENTTPAMFNWQMGTAADIETEAYNTDGSHYTARAMLIECTMSYNGAIKQTNVAHEIGRG